MKRYRVEGKLIREKKWTQVGSTDDKTRALSDAVRRARLTEHAVYRVMDRGREIWKGSGIKAKVKEWEKKRPPQLVGLNKKPMNKPRQKMENPRRWKATDWEYMDWRMFKKGYRYKLIPKSKAFDPLYTKTITHATSLMRKTYPKEKFNVIDMRPPMPRTKKNPLTRREASKLIKKGRRHLAVSKRLSQRKSRETTLRSAFYAGAGGAFGAATRPPYGPKHRPGKRLVTKATDLLDKILAKNKTRKNPTKGAYPFARKEKQYAKYTLSELRWSRKDAYEAAKAMKGRDPMAEGWYMDDVSTIIQELRRRGVKGNPVRRGKGAGTNPTKKKGIPKGQLEWVVGNMHVRTSDAEVEKEIRKRATGPDWTEAATRKAVAYALKVHHKNQDLVRKFRFNKKAKCNPGTCNNPKHGHRKATKSVRNNGLNAYMSKVDAKRAMRYA